jgi:broad specificity phosphatase PhoE
METHLFLVRHGQSEGNAARRFGGHSDTPLSELGKKQAVATARHLTKQRISAVYSSDLLRTMQTAEPLAQLNNLQIESTNAFRERDVGVLSGLTFSEAETRFPLEHAALINRDFDYVMRGGESYRQMLTRASGKLEEILGWHQGEKVAVFAHTGTICFLILHLLGALIKPGERFVWISTKNCGITHFEFRDKGLALLKTVNDTRHLSYLQKRHEP